MQGSILRGNNMESVATEPVTRAPKPKFQFPFLDLKAQFATVRDEVMTAVTRVMQNQHFILGPEVEALEAEVATYLDAPEAVGCASGSDALLLALIALGVQAGDEVVTSPFTFVATTGSIARVGYHRSSGRWVPFLTCTY